MTEHRAKILEQIKQSFEWGRANLEEGIQNLTDEQIAWLIEQNEQPKQLRTKTLIALLTKEQSKWVNDGDLWSKGFVEGIEYMLQANGEAIHHVYDSKQEVLDMGINHEQNMQTVLELKNQLQEGQRVFGGDVYTRIQFEDGVSLAVELVDDNQKSSYHLCDDLLALYQQDQSKEERLQAIGAYLDSIIDKKQTKRNDDTWG